MRGRMFVRGALVAGLVASISGCGTEEAACFEGPSVTYTAQFFDFLADEPREGVAFCLMVDSRPCGCRTSNANGWVDLEIPADTEVTVRASDGDLINWYIFPRSVRNTSSSHRPPSRTLVSGLGAFLGVEVSWDLGVVGVDAFPVEGASLEGTVVDLVDASGAPVQSGDGPVYVVDRMPYPDASASLGPSVLAVWANLPPGPIFARLTGSDGEPLLDRCDLHQSGWRREINGEAFFEFEVFAGAVSTVIARYCEP
jgi:hypothetical protein